MIDITLEDGTTLEVYQDDYPSSPREWTNICTLIFFGKYSHLGDDHNLIQMIMMGGKKCKKLSVRN